MPDLGIIFAHHTLDDATRTNLDSFRRWHSQGPIITVSGSDDVFEGPTSLKPYGGFVLSPRLTAQVYFAVVPLVAGAAAD